MLPAVGDAVAVGMLRTVGDAVVPGVTLRSVGAKVTGTAVAGGSSVGSGVGWTLRDNVGIPLGAVIGSNVMGASVGSFVGARVMMGLAVTGMSGEDVGLGFMGTTCAGVSDTSDCKKGVRKLFWRGTILVGTS